MKKCKKCGHICEDRTVFCEKCGTPLSSAGSFSEKTAGTLKNIAASSEFSLLVFTLTAVALLSIIGNIIFDTVPFNMVQILLCVASWLIWGAVQRSDGNMSLATGGFVLIRIVLIILLVIASIGFGTSAVVLLLGGVAVLFAGSGYLPDLYHEQADKISELRETLLNSSTNDYTWSNDAKDAIEWIFSEDGFMTIAKYFAVACLVLFIAMVASLIVYTLFFKSLLNYSDSSRAALQGGNIPKKQLSVFPIVILIIGAAGSGFGVIASLIGYILKTPDGADFFRTCITALSTVVTIFTIRILLKVRKNLNPEIENGATPPAEAVGVSPDDFKYNPPSNNQQ